MSDGSCPKEPDWEGEARITGRGHLIWEVSQFGSECPWGWVTEVGQSTNMDCGLCWGKSLSLTMKWRHAPSSEAWGCLVGFHVRHTRAGAANTPKVSASQPLALPDFFPSSSFSPSPQPTCLSSFLTTSPGFHILPSPPPPPASHTHTLTHVFTHTHR